jgi:hypothetical protein
VNADPDPAFLMNADPDPDLGYTLKIKNLVKVKKMLNFNENKVTTQETCYTNYIDFYTFLCLIICLLDAFFSSF